MHTRQTNMFDDPTLYRLSCFQTQLNSDHKLSTLVSPQPTLDSTLYSSIYEHDPPPLSPPPHTTISHPSHQMAPKLATITTALFLLLLLALTVAATSPAASVEFVRASCSSTLYPALCFSSLSPYAATINHDPLKLSQLATSLSLSRLRSVSVNKPAAATSSTLVAGAVEDCVQLLGNAATRTKDSMNELKKLKKKSKGVDVRWCLFNVQTWMSAALTSEETCTDGLNQAGAGPRPSTEVGVAKEYTSIALALVNKLAN